MIDFVFNLSPKIISGIDVLLSLGEAVSPYGSRFMLIQDSSFKDIELVVKIKQSLEQKGLKLFSFDVIKKSPDTETVLRVLKLAEAAHIDAVVVLGDVVTCSVAKAVALLYNEKKSIYNYLEGEPVTEKSLPLIQIPTTCNNPFLFANSVYITDSRNRKVSALKCRENISPIAVFDSNIFKTASLNQMREMILSSISVATDAYISRRSNFFSDALLKKALHLLSLALDAENNSSLGKTIEEIVTQCAVLMSIALGTSSPGLATAIATVGNGRYDIAFSSFLPIMLPQILRDSISSNLQKVAEIVSLFEKDNTVLESDLETVALRGIETISKKLLNSELPAKLGSLDLAMDDLSAMAEGVLMIDFINYIPRSLASQDILEILKNAY